MSLYFRYCRAWSVKSERLTLHSVSTALACEVFWDLSKCNSGSTLRSRPKDTALATTMLHALTRVRKGDYGNGCTRKSGAIITLATVNVSDVAIASRSLEAPGPVVVRGRLALQL